MSAHNSAKSTPHDMPQKWLHYGLMITGCWQVASVWHRQVALVSTPRSQPENPELKQTLKGFPKAIKLSKVYRLKSTLQWLTYIYMSTASQWSGSGKDRIWAVGVLEVRRRGFLWRQMMHWPLLWSNSSAHSRTGRTGGRTKHTQSEICNTQWLSQYDWPSNRRTSSNWADKDVNTKRMEGLKRMQEQWIQK